MQNTIDNLQDILSHGNLNLDPSMLYSVSKDLVLLAEIDLLQIFNIS